MCSAVYSGSSLFISDWIVYTIITILSLNFKMIGGEFNEILSQKRVRMRDLQRVVTHHAKLIDICNQLEAIVSQSLLYNYLQGVIIICLSNQLAVYGFVLMIVLAQVFMMTFHGQMLIDASSEVTNDIYTSEWYSIDDDRNVMRAVVLSMIISQEPKYLTAGGFVKVSLDMFTVVINI